MEESTAPIFDSRIFAKTYDYRGSDLDRKDILRKLYEKNVHCFGRFGVWKPDVFVHQEIERFIEFLDMSTDLMIKEKI